MKRVIGLVAMVLLAAGPVAAQKVTIDWDRNADLDGYQTFMWVDGPPTPLEGNYPQVHMLIKHSIEYWLVKGGMKENLENPDLNITYHTGGKDSYQFLHTSFGYTYPVGWGYMGGTYTSGSMVNTYREGTIVIDIWDPNTKKAVFRGTASKTLAQDPAKALEQIDAMIEKIAVKFKKMRAKEEK